MQKCRFLSAELAELSFVLITPVSVGWWPELGEEGGERDRF